MKWKWVFLLMNRCSNLDESGWNFGIRNGHFMVLKSCRMQKSIFLVFSCGSISEWLLLLLLHSIHFPHLPGGNDMFNTIYLPQTRANGTFKSFILAPVLLNCHVNWYLWLIYDKIAQAFEWRWVCIQWCWMACVLSQTRIFGTIREMAWVPCWMQWLKVFECEWRIFGLMEHSIEIQFKEWMPPIWMQI